MARLSSQPDARLLAIGELDAGGLESQNDLRDRVTVRRLVCGSAGSRYNRAEIVALSAIRRSLNLPSSETFPVYRRCRAIIERGASGLPEKMRKRSGPATKPPTALKQLYCVISITSGSNWR